MGVAREPQPRNDVLEVDTDAVLLAAVVAMHGPLDMAVTAAFWELESNPAVLALGIGPWLAIKVVVLAALVGVWLSIRRHRATRAMLGVLAVLGALLIVPNLAIAGVAA